LAPYCEPGEHFYCGGWIGPVPAGWQLHADTTGHQMLWDCRYPDADDEFPAAPLDASHVPQMLELVELRLPGPFAARTHELGDTSACSTACAWWRWRASAWRRAVARESAASARTRTSQDAACAAPHREDRRREIERGQMPFST
jgi:hypothetical protein